MLEPEHDDRQLMLDGMPGGWEGRETDEERHLRTLLTKIEESTKVGTGRVITVHFDVFARPRPRPQETQ